MALADALRDAGVVDTAVPQGDLAEFHAALCARLGWLHRHWDGVGRELARLPGVTRKVVRVDGERVTIYQLAPAADVVALDARRRA